MFLWSNYLSFLGVNKRNIEKRGSKSHWIIYYFDKEILKTIIDRSDKIKNMSKALICILVLIAGASCWWDGGHMMTAEIAKQEIMDRNATLFA